ncbi:replication initiator protein A, partial [Aerococcus sp. HMSC06H08]
MTNNNFYNLQEVYGNLELGFPRAFLDGDEYKNLSSDAKIAYMAFKNRLGLSIINGWVDENNNLYFIFTVKELCILLNRSNKTAIKIKKELVDMGLLFEQKGGFNTKKKKNEPNRLYLLNLEVSKNTIDTFIKSEKRLQTLPYQQSVESTPRREEIDMSKTLINQGSVK